MSGLGPGGQSREAQDVGVGRGGRRGTPASALLDGGGGLDLWGLEQRQERPRRRGVPLRHAPNRWGQHPEHLVSEGRQQQEFPHQ